MTSIAFADLSTAIVNDACLRLGVRYGLAPPGLQALRPGDKIAGPVCPVRHSGRGEVFFEALERARAGDVLVIDNEGRPDEGCIGDLVAVEALHAGVVGIVLWGAYRDKFEIRELGLPVFAYGTFPRGPVDARDVPSDSVESARLGSTRTSRLDWAFADEDGAIFVPASKVEAVLEVGAEIRRTERHQCDLANRGTSIRAQFDFARFLEIRDRDATYTFAEHVKSIGGAFGE